ncbi:T9SS type A sorting domain-containing protein [Winogradskyella helgolandensis]|uniref:T9SS type A sorting domain-containing protein n=1 Tax=Winogradskyella helgolandensis TaxID=2697010 RepID=UPI0015CA6038|nr:T9SS type A sorting domain-containing protein [Winogradskyella helgolandensis]
MPLVNLPKYTKNLLLILFLNFSLLSISAQQQLAFPTAYGAGAYVSGGRGQTVYHVTTTDFNDNEGSFKWAFEQASANNGGTIVFDISGVITIQPNETGRWFIDHTNNLEQKTMTNISILGQTAPFPGITIDTSVTYWEPTNMHNIIFRYIKFRGSGENGFLNMRYCDEVIMDHCSFAWSAFDSTGLNLCSVTDHNLDGNSWTPTGITLQNCFLSHIGRASNIGNTSTSSLAPFGEVSLLRNVYTNTSYRTPLKHGGDGEVDVINNFIESIQAQYGARMMRFDNQAFYLNHIGNSYSTGYHSGHPSFNGNDVHRVWVNDPSIGAKIYQDDNYYAPEFQDYGIGDYGTDPQSDWLPFQDSAIEVPSNWFVNTPRSLNGRAIPILNSSDLKTELLPEVGASKYIDNNGQVVFYRDEIDTRYINDLVAGIHRDDERLPSDRPGFDISQTSNTRPNDFYNSNDHIPESYLLSRGIIGNSTIHNQIQPSGYTLLEEYANQVDFDITVISLEGVEVLPSIAELQITDTLQLTATFTPDNATNQNGVWTSSDESIATVDENGIVTPVSLGQVIITFTASDGGFSGTSEITVFPEALNASAGDDQQICEGESTILNASGGTNYVWSTGETADSIEVTPDITTTYTVTVSDDNGQSEEANVTVTVNALPVANAGEDQSICEGSSTTLTATGGVSYLWSTGETTASIEVSPTEESIYTVEVSDNNCSSSDSVTVFVNAAPEIIISEDIVIFEGESATLTVSGSDTYEWSTGETTESITVIPLITTAYTVNSIGPNGCVSYAEVTVTVIPEIIANAGDDETICSGETITLTALGGSNYTWDTGDLGPELTVSPIETTTYTVTVEDDYGNTDTDEITVFVNEAPSITVNDDVFIMIGSSVTLTANGGSTYSWNTGETTSEISVSPDVTTTYTVTGFSENGCQSIEEVIVNVVEELIANAGEDATICLGESVTLNASGGISYTWNTGETGATPTFTPTENTTYTVTVTDGFGNSDTDDVTITVNPAPIANAGEDQTLCQSESAVLTAEGGDTYLWSTGETTDTIVVNPNVDTIYTVEAFVGSCSDTDDVSVFVLPTPELTLSDDIIIVIGNSTSLEVSGANSYLWSTGEISNSIVVNPTETTTYTVTGYSESGCEGTGEVTVTVIPEINADAGNDTSICNGESITLTASGGINYSWSTGETSASIIVNPIETETYTVTVSDTFGSSDSDSVTVTVNDLPIITLSQDITIFEGESTNLTVNGASSYLWNTGETASAISVSPLETTTYSVIGYSESGCESTSEVTVTVIPEINADAGNDTSICNGEGITLTASGGINYSWSTGETSASIIVNPIETETYTVTVSDTFGSSDSDSVTVTVNDLPIITLSQDITIFEGESTNLTVNGASSYLWNTGETASAISVSPLETTTYSVIGYSESGCESTSEVTVTVIPEINADAGNDTSICNGEGITLTASGGINYSWSTGETSASIIVNPIETETYTVTVSDTFGSSDSDSVTVTVNDSPIITLSQDITIFEGESTNLTVNGASSYLWNTGETASAIFVSPLETTTYSVIGYSESGCESTGEVTVTVIPEINADAGNDTSICNGESVTLTASGGINYSWSTGETSASIIVNPTETETYTVTVSDNFGSSDSDSVTVTVNELPIITVSENITIIQGESTNLSVNGAETYLWNTGATTSSISVSPAQTTTYNVVGITNTCSSEEKEVTVTVIPLFIASAGTDERVCDNQNYEVVLTATQGDSYLWSTGEITQSIVVSPLSTATYSVTVTSGEQTATDDVMVYVDPSPNVVIANGDSVDILNGDFVTLSVSGANTYEWNNGASQPNIAVSPSITTTYEVKGFIGQCYDDKQVTVNVLQPVVADAGEDVLICLEDLTTLTASGGDDYVWSTGETTPTITVSPIETTDYTVTVFNALDFDEATVRVEVDANCTVDSINPIEDEDTELEFDIYPNPASGIVNVKISGTLNVSDINIYDVTGKLIKNSKVSNENLSYTTTTQIGISTLQSGVYFVKLIDKDRVITKKLIVN